MQPELPAGSVSQVLPQAFVMLNAPVCEPEADEAHGYYDPQSQTWVGQIRIGAGTYSSRSNGAKGGYSQQSDD